MLGITTDLTNKAGFDMKAHILDPSSGRWVMTASNYYADQEQVYLRAFNAYMLMDEGRSYAGIPSQIDSSLTGIRAAEAAGTIDSDGWYDLQGRRLSAMPSEKGVYINNGRKVIIK